MVQLSGSCLCRAVKFEFNGDPVVSLRCHCRDCQYVSGGEPADALVVPKDGLQIMAGIPRVYRSVADSGIQVHRAFCADCGTPLFAGSDNHPGVVGIKLGALDDPERYPPQGHIWTVSKRSWHHIGVDSVTFEQNPPGQ